MFQYPYNWFLTQNFWKKLLILITLQTIIILIMSNILLGVIFKQIEYSSAQQANNQKLSFQESATRNILQAIVRKMLTSINLESNKIQKLIQGYKYFESNPNLAVNIQNDNFPLQTSKFQNISYNDVGFYFRLGRNDSVFRNTYNEHAYLDKILSTFFMEKYIYSLHRINIIYQSTQNPQDIFVRTVPAKKTFNISQSSSVTKRMEFLVENYINVSRIYPDQFDSQDNTSILGAIRTIIRLNDKNILFQVQVDQSLLTFHLSNHYFFPSGKLFYFYMLNQTAYQLRNQIQEYVNLTQFVNPGYYPNNQINGVDVIVSNLAIPVSHMIGTDTTLEDQQYNKLRVILIVDKKETQVASKIYQDFLSFQDKSLYVIISAWSIFMIILMMSIAGRVGSQIFSSLTHLSENLESYTKNPSKQYSIIIKLKEMQTTGITKKLTDSLITIIQRIEFRKKQAKDQIQPVKYPLNMAHKQFTNRMGIDESQIVHQLKQKIKKNNESVETNDKKYQKL